MPVRKKTTAAPSTAVVIHRVERPGGLVAIYERHDDGTVTRRIAKTTVALPATVEGGDAA